MSKPQIQEAPPTAAELSEHFIPSDDMAPVVALGGLMTVKRLAPWYAPLLNSGESSPLTANERFIPPPHRGLGSAEEMRDETIEELEGIFDQLGERMVLVGHSLGGHMATEVAMKRPDMVAGVVALAGVQGGYKKETPATLALRKSLGNPAGGDDLKYESEYMEAHRGKMAKEWSSDIPLHLISVPVDVLLPLPIGLDLELPENGPQPHRRVVLPKVPGMLRALKFIRGMPEDVQILHSKYPTEHLNIPRNPAVINYVNQVRRTAVGNVVDGPTLLRSQAGSRQQQELATAA